MRSPDLFQRCDLASENHPWGQELGKCMLKSFCPQTLQYSLPMSNLSILRPETKTNQRFIEELGNNVKLEMVLIKGGTFIMGSPETEINRSKSESPKHSVTVPQFFMGRYPITQSQWRAVAQSNRVKQDLDSDPSNFKGDDRPVEQVSWEDTVEFCDLISQLTGRTYRLPTEAEWEYACRAGTTTPFHFGETISDELANYRASKKYGKGVEGESRGKTSSVYQFNAPNDFGLHDMHGNVWEWCADYWHENYVGAPTNGQAWIEDGDSRFRVVRGGSWGYTPAYCRSACRRYRSPADRYGAFGFRVVC